MADRDIIQNMIVQLGQSQGERPAPELEPHHADVDERSTDDLWAWTREFAGLVNYYQGTNFATPTPWSSLFPDVGSSVEQYIRQADGTVPPHVALYLAFLEQLRVPQELLNQVTGRHLDFYYREVLGLRKRGPSPDRAHVLLELKKGAASTIVGPEQIFSAGKDAIGIELLYAPVMETVIGAARVESLRSIFRDPQGADTIRFAPIANSEDGLGGAITSEEPKWRAFGHAGLPAAEVGFALSSPVLRLREGTRKATLRLALGGTIAPALTNANLVGAFNVFLTGEKSWIEPDGVTATFGGGVLQVELTLSASAPPVVDYAQAVHGYAYAAEAPIVQLLLKAGALLGYADFVGATVTTASVAVEVEGVTSLTLEGDAGGLDPKKAFQPFGPEGSAGSRFMVSYPEAMAKKLSEVKIALQWKDAPQTFSTHYTNYGVTISSNGHFTAAVAFRDAAGTPFTATSVALFGSDARSEKVLTLTPGNAVSAPVMSVGQTIRALKVAGSAWSSREALRRALERPVHASFLDAAPKPREGFITLTLNTGFLHPEYRKKYVEYALTYAKADPPPTGGPTVINEPYTPTVQAISLSYKAFSDAVAVSGGDAAAFANPDAQLFHVAPFGPARVHGFERANFSFVGSTQVPLVPSFSHAGELLIGLSGIGPGDGVSLLFQVAAGSADPELPREKILWFVLCDNHWKPLGPEELVLDTTNQLLASGIVKLVIPLEATTTNTLLPTGYLWVKAAVAGNVGAVSQLIAVAPNAVEVELVERGNDPTHLESALAPKSIAKLKNGLAPVKGVSQPYSSFGGGPAERDGPFRTRVSERLRHKNRCVTPWDYERVVLEGFPGVHRVKCIPHAKEGSWMAPGHVMLVVIPDLRNRNAVDPLQPRVDADTQSRILEHVRERAGPQVQVAVKNPRYQKIRLRFSVRFHRGYEYNQYRDELERAVIRTLSPWAFDATREISFGGAIYRSVLLNVIEELEYVDFVTDFQMFTFTDTANNVDVGEARPETPDAILVSDAVHEINPVP